MSNVLHQSKKEITSSWTVRVQRLKRNSVMLPFEQSTTANVTFKYIDYPTYAQPKGISFPTQSSKVTDLTDKAHPVSRKSYMNAQRTSNEISGVNYSIHCVTTKVMAREIDSSIA